MEAQTTPESTLTGTGKLTFTKKNISGAHRGNPERVSPYNDTLKLH